MTKRMATTIITTKQHQNDSDNSASLVQSGILTLFVQLKHTQMHVKEHTKRGKYTYSHTFAYDVCLLGATLTKWS